MQFADHFIPLPWFCPKKKTTTKTCSIQTPPTRCWLALLSFKVMMITLVVPLLCWSPGVVSWRLVNEAGTWPVDRGKSYGSVENHRGNLMESVLSFFGVPPLSTTRFPLKTHSRSNYDTEYLILIHALLWCMDLWKLQKSMGRKAKSFAHHLQEFGAMSRCSKPGLERTLNNTWSGWVSPISKVADLSPIHVQKQSQRWI